MAKQGEVPARVSTTFAVFAVTALMFLMSLGYLGWHGFKQWRLTSIAKSGVDVQGQVIDAKHHRSTRTSDGDTIETNTYKLKAKFEHASGSVVIGEREVSQTVFAQFSKANEASPLDVIIVSDATEPTKWHFRAAIDEGVDLTLYIVLTVVSFIAAAVSGGLLMHFKRQAAKA